MLMETYDSVSRTDPCINTTSHTACGARLNANRIDEFKLTDIQPTTPHRARSMTADHNCTASSSASSSSTTIQSPRVHEGSVQKVTNGQLVQVPGLSMQRHTSYASNMSPPTGNMSDSLLSPRRPFFNSNAHQSTMFNSATPSMTGIPEYLAVQEMAFRQGQHDYNGSSDRIPPSPFSKHFDHVWEEYYKLGGAYRRAPAVSPKTDSFPSHENYAWSVLINPATQDLEHPNGTFDREWARKICTMALNCMKELIRNVCKHPNDWRKIVCDIPLPTKHAIEAFPDLSASYGALKRDAHEAMSGRVPLGY
ncbi:uncharacterized protein yc1106_07145 [Curvularia clavata]|uniref:Uncharacterized protein n=1 Tax=Curvularia clavata TaxID=95742 RepID=A0A9Q8ZB19_CURCL|nr:uncharacterized protein yc1106_07145 [Curvularia clavata]